MGQGASPQTERVLVSSDCEQQMAWATSREPQTRNSEIFRRHLLGPVISLCLRFPLLGSKLFVVAIVTVINMNPNKEIY